MGQPRGADGDSVRAITAAGRRAPPETKRGLRCVTK